MAYQDWFDSWHGGEVHLRGYFQSPDKLTTKEIPRHDASAARLLEEARQLIEDLTAYRQALAARYAMLETAPCRLCLELVRRPSWGGGGVSFTLRLFRRYDDGTEIDELHERYTGRQRREAIARYEALRRSRPGIQAEKDLERRPWER